MAMWRSAAIALLVVLALPAAAAAPVPYRADYEVLRNGAPLGTAEVVLEAAGDGSWRYVNRTRGTRGLAGLAGAEILEQSHFRLEDGQPRLIDYRYRQDIAWRSKERSLAIVDGGAAIDSRDGERRYRLPFDAAAMDRQTVVLAIGADLARGAEALAYRVADRDEVEEQRYRRAGEETLDTARGPIAAVKVERLRERPGRSTTSWFAPSLGWLPVRIVHREGDGDTLELRLVGYEPSG